MVLSKLSDAELLKYMSLFGQLPQIEKNKIIFIVYKNHLMFLKENFPEKFEYFYGFLNTLLSKNSVKSETTIKIKTVYDILELFNKYITNSKTFFEDCLLFNNILISNSLCPLVLYAFNNLIFEFSITKKDIKEIIEFSLMNLYRAIDDKEYKKGAIINNIALLTDSGAVSDIYLSNNQIIKYPKTLASRLFLMQQEIETYNYLIHTNLKKFLADNYTFDSQNKILSHNFIRGENGEFYLFNHITFQKKQLDSLRQFYISYKKLSKNITLDIHPGNFIWDEARDRWVIVDLGILPSIGSWYYDYNTFEDYFENIWLKREETMQKVPIRSLDFALDLDIKDKISKK